MVPLIGYVDRFSARPGERLAVKVSSQLDRPYRADLVRIIHADANPVRPCNQARGRARRVPKDLIPAEIVYFETTAGGAVFSIGSITFCGSLFYNNYDNNVSRMLENVLRRFASGHR